MLGEALEKSDMEGSPKVGALIRGRRRQQHMTLEALGRAAQVSVGYLSQVERDHATPSLGTLAQIGRALGVGIDYFFSSFSAQDALTRAEGRHRFSLDGSSIIYERLGTEFPGNTLSSFIMTVPPGYRSETVSHDGEEILFVLDGSITQWVDDEEMVMGVGDSLHFRGDRPHSWANPTDHTARLLWTGTLNIFRSKSGPARPVKAVAKPGLKPVKNNKTIEQEKRI